MQQQAALGQYLALYVPFIFNAEKHWPDPF